MRETGTEELTVGKHHDIGNLATVRTGASNVVTRATREVSLFGKNVSE